VIRTFCFFLLFLFALNAHALGEDTLLWGMADYSPADLFLPNKYGATLGMSTAPDTGWEMEYLHGGFSFPLILKDLGHMSDNRFSVIRRSFWTGSSWNVSYGLTYFEFSSHLGSQLLSSATSNNIPSIDLVTVRSLGFNLALGNRWFFCPNWMVGVDWISWSQPLWLLERRSDFLDHSNSQGDKDRVASVIQSLSHLPRFAVLKLQIGFYF